ncbi:YceI family protein [Dyadobacter sp. LJ53]|uniref:YceI family protein n=1 Tax=Dyadobacter chenwenxiniae TaxID=2906456 RepID=UPI001F37904A|nr:YceI family protein [Dyadobacter chenwenxiniae]MCF0051871.1 YceI family protein [Dyadobacter chenwenxiniae]
MKTIILSAISAVTMLWAGCKTDEITQKQVYVLNEETSVAEWKGAMPDNANTGSFAVKSKDLEVENGKVTGGSFIIPIASIKNFNLPDAVKPQLLEHLKSADFFNMAVHPEAAFKITKVQPYTGRDTAAIAGANFLVTGDFTMIGKTNSVTFPAKIDVNEKNLKTEAKFSIDRTKWGMTYATDPKAEGHYIYNDVAIHLKLDGTRKGSE